MLRLFYLSVFYLPCLKRLASKYQRTQEVNTWFVQMMCYNRASLLLKLSNDVEENPGPTTIHEIVIVNCTQITVSADYSQSDLIFGQNSSKQCVVMSLRSLTSIVQNRL